MDHSVEGYINRQSTQILKQMLEECKMRKRGIMIILFPISCRLLNKESNQRTAKQTPPSDRRGVAFM